MPEKITVSPDGTLSVPDEPIIPFIEGDGTGVDIWPAAKAVLDASAKKHGKTIVWKEVLAGEKAYRETGNWLPDETVATFNEYLIGIKGPLTTPIGGGIRSLNVALRQILDLYVCLRPVRWFEGVPSPVKHPEKVDMVIFRENTEDIYAGLEVQEGTPEAKRLIQLLQDDCGGNPGDKILVKDNIADITLQQVLTRPEEFDVIATTNLNGDYLSDALAAQVGGIGIAPGGNINYVTGHGIFEATHGTAPKYAGQDKVNPGSLLLSGVLMLEHLGWEEAAEDIVRALEATIAERIVTYDFARLMEGATEVKTSEFAAAVCDRL